MPHTRNYLRARPRPDTPFFFEDTPIESKRHRLARLPRTRHTVRGHWLRNVPLYKRRTTKKNHTRHNAPHKDTLTDNKRIKTGNVATATAKEGDTRGRKRTKDSSTERSTKKPRLQSSKTAVKKQAGHARSKSAPATMTTRQHRKTGKDLEASTLHVVGVSIQP
eukprot:GILJ01022004.1.p1 GENE.GILJ01022004.1~~GILJ01022004.1.p1  ORF type:complete len:164 (+),score=11.49 GILJ01022004.1:129-620(+)